MRRLAVVALLAFVAGPAFAQGPGGGPERKVLKFDPAEVVSAEKAIRPYNSVAFGTVVVQVTVNAAGDAEQVNVLRGIPSLTEAALESLKKWKFQAARLGGKPVPSATQVAFVFSPPVSGASSPAVSGDSELPVNFEPARVITPDEAMYPPLSIAAGTVVLKVTVNASGEPEETKVVRGIPSLTEQALRSIKKWKFDAARLEGQPVRSTVHVAYVFTPPDNSP